MTGPVGPAVPVGPVADACVFLGKCNVPSGEFVLAASRAGVCRFFYHLYREPYDQTNNGVLQ